MLKRRVFTREFKVEAVALVSRQGLSFAEAARRLEIGQNLLLTVVNHHERCARLLVDGR